MPNIYARSVRSGKLYEVNISGTQPTPEEQAYIEQRIDNIEGFGAVEAPLPVEETDDASAAGNLISGFGRGFLTSFTELPGGIVGLGESALGYEPGSTAIGEVAQDISDAGREGVEYLLGESDGSVSSKTGETFGSLASFLVPGTAAAKVAKVAGSGIKGQKVAGLTGAGAMGVGLGAKDQINRVADQIAQGKEVDAEDFIAATRLGGVIGATEILPFQRVLGDVLQILRKVPKGNQEDAIKTIAGRLKRAAGTFAAEGAQEAVAGIAQDLVEKNYYNPEANIGATADEEFIYGGSAGAALSFLVDSIRGRQINKMDKAFTQLQDDLADESAETAEKASFAAKSVQSGEGLPGQPKLLTAPKTDEDIVEGSEQEADTKLKSLGLSPEEEAIASAQSARERTTGFAKVKLSALPEDEAARIRTRRLALGIEPDQDVDLNELQETIGQEAYVREYKKQKPNMWRESGENPRNQKSFSFEQYDRAVAAVRSQKKATVPVIQAAAKAKGKPVPLSVVRDIQQEMSRKGVLNQVGENKWEVMEERAEQESPAAPLRRSYNELERKIDEVRQERLQAQERRDAAKDKGDTTVARTAEQEMAEADRRIDRLNNTRSNVETQLNEIDPENPVVNSIDTTQQEANRARQVSEAVSQEQITDEYARKRQRVANALRKYLNAIGLGDRVDLVTQNVIFPEGVDSEAKFEGVEDQLRAQGVIEGFEQAGENGRRVIGIAMEIYDPKLSEEELALKLRGVMNHEMIHALRGLGLFTDKEWQTLTNAARNKKRVRFVGGKLQEREYTYYDRAEAIYGPMGADQNLMAEEAVAEMFRDYVDGKLKIAGKPQSLLKRITRFFTSIFRSHNDAGFRQAADIFQNITTTDKAKQIGRRDTGYGEVEIPQSNKKYSTAGIRAGFIVPEKGNIERIRQSFKDVTKRIPNLTEAAKKLSDGTISYDEYDKLVNEFKPIIPYDTVPAPESMVDMRNALEASDKRKLEKLGKGNLIENGRRVKLRLDIPAYTRQGVWIPTIHGQDNRTIAHESTAIITDAQFSASEKVAVRIAAGAQKGPFATIDGSFVQASPDEAFTIAQEMMNDPDVVQVGFDPERHSYFYDRTTTQPVVAAEQVVQIGPLVLAKNPTFAGKDKFKYSVAPPAPLNGISQFLTNEEVEDILRGRKNVVESKADRIAKIFSELPSAENFAAVAIAGQAKKGWYRNSAKAIMDIFGIHDARRFTALLAATSPQTSVEMNAINTLSIWANWNNAGRPQDPDTIIKIMGESVLGDKGVDSILPAWKANSIRALTAPFGQEMNILLSGPKVNSFMLNLVNELDEVTNDTWMANFALIEQPLFKGFKRAGGKDAVGEIGLKGPGYLAFSARTREAAKAASEITGDSWAPAEIQETVWSLSKALLETRKSKGNTLTAKELLTEGIITDQQVADVPDFATLFTDGVYGRILEDAGYKQRLDAIRSRETGDGVTIEPRAVYSAEGVSANPDFIRRELGEFADRLEVLAVNGKKALRKLSSTVPANIRGAKRAAIDVRIGAGFNGRVFTEQRGSRTLNGYNVVSTYKVGGNSARRYSEESVSTPLIMELDKSNESAEQFFQSISAAKASLGDMGESVYVYPIETSVSPDGYTETGYEDMRMFLTEDGTAGFALKETGTDGVVDIVSVFNTSGGPNKGINYPLIRLATEQGGNTLDAFDIYLPKLYSANGFKVRSRLKWDDEQAPDGWSKEAFKQYNNGEPDVVFMYYQPDRVDVYEQGSQEGELFTDYMEAVDAQLGAALSPASVYRYKDLPPTDRKLSVAFSAIDPNRIQNQIPVAQDSLMYSRASNLLARVLGVVYDRNKAEDIADNFLQKFQDSMLPVGRMIDDLKAQGATITDANDTYLREELYHGITGSKIADNEKNLYEPMLNLVKDIELTESQVSSLRANSRFVREALQEGRPLKQVLADAFLYARHAKERNAYIRSIDPANDSGSGMTDTEAVAITQFFDSLSATERQRFINIGLAADRIVQSTNDIRVASGLTPDFNDGGEVINAETGEVVPAGPNYTSYVPLRGILDPENESNEEYSGRPSSRPKFGARGREDMRMFGRFEFAKDIMANLMVQNQNAIVRSERNRVGQSFLNMLRNEPRLTDSYARIVEQRPTIRVLSGGVVKTRPDPRFADRDDILIVKEDGQEVAIQIDDPRIALAMRGASGMSPQHASGLVKVLGKVNRYLSNINTSWNPEFLITNMVRDLQTAGVNINQYEMNGLTSDALKTIPSALKGIKRSIVNDDNTSEWSKIYKDFVDAGGQNATNMMGDLSDQLGRLEDMLKEVSDAGANGAFNKTKAGFGKILETLENYNTVVENGVRVATYKALLDRGFSRERAAQAARNVTVNFAKGGEYKTFMNSMYLFYNASLQGSFALLNGALRSSKVRKLWVGAMVTGILLDQMNSIISDDDEDGQEIYDKIPDYVLEKNLILMDPFGILPSERGYFKVPMPYGLNMAVNMGRSLSRAGRGAYTPSEATSTLVGTIIDTVNPIGDTPRIPLVDKDFEFQDILTTVSPSIGDPVVQYLTNSDYARKPIYKEPSSFGVPAPESQIHWTTTSPSAVFIANFLRKPFGLGDASDVRPGLIEVSPDTLEFWFDYATGGVGRFVQRTAEFGASTAPKIMAGEFEEAMLRSTPAVRQVVGSVSEREDLGKFVEKRDRVLLTRKDFLDARKKGDEERAQRIALAYKEELRVSGIINALNNARNKLVRKRKQVEESQYIPEAQKKVLIERMNARIKELVTRANSLMSNL